MSTMRNLLAPLLASFSLLSEPAAFASETGKGVALSPVVADPQSPFLAVQVASNGRFNMGVNPTAPPCGSGPTFPTPCQYNISFAWPGSPGTSFTTVRIDGADHRYGDSGLTQPPTDSADGLSNASAEDVASIHTTQQLTIVPGQTGNLDTARIRYVVTNMDTVPHQVGLRVMTDTMLNNNDGAPFRVGGMPITTETDFVGAAVPSFWDAFFDLTVPGISARGTLIGGGATPPDRFVIADWGNIVDTLFDFTVTAGLPVTGDSAVAVYWNPVQLAAGESRVFDTFYGASSAVGTAGLLVTAPHSLSVVPGPTAGTLQWSPNPFMVVAFFTSSPGGAILDVDIDLDLSGASSLSVTSPNPQHFAGVQPGQTVSATWMVQASAPGDEHYAVRVLASPSGSVLAEQQIETVIPELIVLPVTNPLNQGPIRLQADGLFCADASMPCATPFPSPGNIGGFPIPQTFEWQGTTPLAFVPGSAGATPGLLTDHGVRSFVYAAVDTEEGGTGQINFYLAYDFLQSALVPFVPGQVFSVLFDVTAGRFAGRMVVSLHCAEGSILVSGFDNGVAFVDRPADQLGIEGGCGGGTSPNPTGDPFFDMFTDTDGVTQGFNTAHPIIELEVPLTRNLGGAPNPGGGVYDPSPAFWSASAPDPSGDPVLSNNMVAINVMDGSTVVTPISAATTTTTTTSISATTTSTTSPPTTTSSTTTTTVQLTTSTTSASTTTTRVPTTTTTSTTGSTTTTCPSACVNPRLGTAGDCTVLAVGGGKVDVTGPAGGIGGDVCIGPNGRLSITGTQFVTGSIRLATGATLSKSGPGSIAAVLTNEDLTAEIDDAVTAATEAAALPCTRTLAALNRAQVITGAGGLNVLCVGDVILNGGQVVTLSGSAGDTFVINVSGRFALTGGSKIVAAGLPASAILYNIIGDGQQVQLSGGGGGVNCCRASIDGTVVALERDIALAPGLVSGEVIGGHDIRIVGGASVSCQSCQAP